MKNNIFILLFNLGIILFIFPFSLFAHNGERAVALPVSKITIDGESRDWPSHLNKYGITRNNIENENDFSAFFQVGYNLEEQSLYVIVEVIDDEHILSSEMDVKLFGQDAHWLFLDVKHERKGSGVAFYALSENSLNLMFGKNGWDKDIREENLNKIDHAVHRDGNTTTYEWQIFLGDELYVNRTIGIDHQIVDLDNDGYSLKSWGIFGGKSSISNNLGDLFILGEDAKEMGTLEGTAQLEAPFSDTVPYGLELVNMDYPDMWTQFPLLRKKEYGLNLPQGRYRIKSALIGNVTNKDLYLSSRGDKGIEVEVVNGKITTAPKYDVKAQKAPPFFSAKQGILPNFKANDTLKVDKFFKEVIHHYTIPGLQLALIKDGEVVYLKNYGDANAYETERVTEDALFDAGSVTKPVFALLVMKLVEEGVIDLDYPLYKYLPYDDIAHDTTYHQLTARHSLTHRTGFPNWRNGKLNFLNPPGTFGYSGEGFVYLSKVVEKLTEENIESLLSKYIIKPLGIKDTYFSTNKALMEKLTFGHDDKYTNALRITETPNMAYSMHTNAKEFSKFIISLMNRDLLAKNTYDKMFAKQVDIPENWSEANTDWKQGFGLGYQLKYSPLGFAYGHSGRNGGYDCSFEVYDDAGVAYVFFTNSSNGFRIKNIVREFLISGNKK
ncbi:serine hydrolase domain-containing protein [uncultured Aquimarina sp.]|uniref:serine hydrolase domain-containing protein n=1 Tax=uncultured Aquimarina sp. TaxID=575652 RepID=UPI0026188C9A|nr:serine hydrolase domain-containing protein [uncultured Aquimarina sp.]